MIENELELVTLSGTTKNVGAQYGEHFRQKLNGFLTQEVPPNKKRIDYAKACWRVLCKQAPGSSEFITGISAGSGLSIEEVTLLSLHEEIVHQTHCTAFAATGAGTRNGGALVGQNWDWKSWRFPWPGLLRLKIKGAPRLLTYHYPGLWASLGINQHGLTLMWTGGGYAPSLRPIVGVPTYALIYDLLLRKNVNEALDYLQSVQHAGCFLFFLGDKEGRIAVVEGIPGKIAIEQGSNYLSRSNHFECPTIIKASHQKLSPTQNANNILRGKLAAKFIQNAGKANGISDFKSHLTRNKDIYRFSKEHMTIDSFVADCRARVLHVARGGIRPGPWRAYEV